MFSIILSHHNSNMSLDPPVEDLTFTPGSTLCFNAPFDLSQQKMTIKLNNPSYATMMFKLVPNIKDPMLKGSNAVSCIPAMGIIPAAQFASVQICLNPVNIDAVTNFDNKITVQYVSAPPTMMYTESHFAMFKTIKKAFITISFNK